MDETTRLNNGGGRRSLGGRYTLQGLLGQGGMADVELAFDEKLDREVAVKILHGRYADDPSFLARFRREAQAAASLNHPNIVGVYDTGEDDGRPYIVMEYVRGKSLRDVLRGQAVAPERAMEIIGDAALGLHYAHERGLVHRDVKPGNILLSEDGRVKVADFGIARAVSAETVTQTAAVFGTAAYVAPEQAQGESVDRRTDVYALGCVLYELLANRQPFAGDSPVALAYKHIHETPPPPSHFNSDVPEALDDVVMKAMAKDPEDRYQTAREFNADLQRAEAGMPVAAPAFGAYDATQVIDSDRTAVVDRPPASRAVYEDEYYDDEPERGRRGLGYALLALLVLGALVLAGVLLSGLFDEQVNQVAVPDVVGLDIAQAQQRLDAQGFDPRLGEQQPSSEFGPNQVISTDPGPREVVPEGSVVTLTYSEGPPMVQVPDVRGRTVEEAEGILQEAGLSIGEPRRRANNQVAEDLVIGTQPPAERSVEEGSAVALIVSTGPEPVAVPDVSGQTQDEATQILEEAGLVVGQVISEASDEVDEDLVIRTEPAAEEEVEPETEVALVVSTGPETVAVPDVSGRTADEAAQLLGEAGLEVGDTSTQNSDEVVQGSVIATDPAAGEEVEQGSTVDLIISAGPATIELPNVENLPEDEALQRLEEACDEPTPCFEVEVVEESSDVVAEGRVIRTEPEAESEVTPGSEVMLVVSQGSEGAEEPTETEPEEDG